MDLLQVTTFAAMDFSAVTTFVGYLIYGALAAIALWGAFCVIVVWRRVGQTSYSSEEEQELFLDTLDDHLIAGEFEEAQRMCDEDDRAMSQLGLLAVVNREMGYRKIRTLITDRFQRDVLSDLEFRLSWVYTVIKSAPMVGLLGTVMGMMGAFQKLTQGDNIEPAQLAEDISFALITTACGLAIAIPLVLSTASINVRIRKLEDLVGVGMTRLMETFKTISTGQTKR
ncbi:MAG: MotA/TolQ/ExbB proton channel family protein [Planctomycetota bacterium]|nr:MotA/TolQ/ExbB proton channel family protein [Planctomycetota bacterium]